jgi:hypothetical protein
MLAHKAMQASYYWYKMSKDSASVKHRDKCERFVRGLKNPPEKLSSISSPWSFAKWGVDIVGPMLSKKGSIKFLVVAMDYFNK